MPTIKVVSSNAAQQCPSASTLASQPDRGVRVSCRNCRAGDHCIAGGVPPEELAKVDEMGFFRRTVRRGEHLYRAGQRFNALYAVRSGFFKTTVLLEEGRTHVTGFHMAGDVIGSDGIGTGMHASEAFALEDSEVCVLTFERLEQLTRHLPGLQRSLHRLLSREIVREQGVMALLGGMSADARVAAFLLNLSYRFKARNYSEREFNLRMSREEHRQLSRPQARDREPHAVPLLRQRADQRAEQGGAHHRSQSHARARGTDGAHPRIAGQRRGSRSAAQSLLTIPTAGPRSGPCAAVVKSALDSQRSAPPWTSIASSIAAIPHPRSGTNTPAVT